MAFPSARVLKGDIGSVIDATPLFCNQQRNKNCDENILQNQPLRVPLVL
jgi:hypothetical protein